MGGAMKVHALASLGHYAEHVRAVWKHLPAELKGDFRFGKREKDKGWPEQDVVLIAGFYDIDRVPNHRIIYVEHGAGQSYRGDSRARSHPAYHNGRHPARVVGYIAPRQDVADAWGRPAVAVGCPIVDDVEDHRLLQTPTAVLTFHWDAYRVCPEASTAYDHYAEALPDIVQRLRDCGFAVLGHAHPRDPAAWFRWNHLGLATCGVDHVRSNADVLIADNTSLAYEMAHLGRGVISLNSPVYRRNISHGLRFWDWVPGRQIDEPEELLAMTESELLNACAWNPWLAEVSNYVYGRQLSDGLAGKRAADWVTQFVSEL